MRGHQKSEATEIDGPTSAVLPALARLIKPVGELFNGEIVYTSANALRGHFGDGSRAPSGRHLHQPQRQLHKPPGPHLHKRPTRPRRRWRRSLVLMADLHNGKLLSVEEAILYVLARY